MQLELEVRKILFAKLLPTSTYWFSLISVSIAKADYSGLPCYSSPVYPESWAVPTVSPADFISLYVRLIYDSDV